MLVLGVAMFKLEVADVFLISLLAHAVFGLVGLYLGNRPAPLMIQACRAVSAVRRGGAGWGAFGGRLVHISLYSKVF